MDVQQDTNGGLRELALFAGAGGGILGGKLLGWRTVCAVERDAYAAAVLAQRQNDRLLEAFPIWSDVTTFDGRPWRGIVDVISGGFPCQDISVAGKGAGISGERSGLWSEFARIIGEVRPRYAFIENSPRLTILGLDTVLSDLASLGYDAEWGCISAADCGANHERNRVWIIGRNMGDTDNDGQVAAEVRKITSKRNDDNQTRPKQASESARSGEQYAEVGNTTGAGLPDGRRGSVAQSRALAELERSSSGTKMADSASLGQPRQGQHERPLNSEAHSNWQADRAINGCEAGRISWWDVEPRLGRVAHGVANRVDRLKAIGNGQVPRVAAVAFELLRGRLDA